MEEYKGYEIFSDRGYYDMIAIRHKGERRFEFTNHFDTVELAKQFIDEQTDYMQALWGEILD